jgi:hypothetical protein
MVAVIWILLFLLAVVWFLWFRRTPLYRAHRRFGVVKGQSGVGGVSGQSAVGNTPTWFGQRHVPPLLPELRPDEDQNGLPGRRWAVRRRRPPTGPSTLRRQQRSHRSVKVFLSDRSSRRSTAAELAATRRRAAALDANKRLDLRSDGGVAHSIARRPLRRSLGRFFSPSEYLHGAVAASLACMYFAVTLLVIVSAIPESNGDTTLTVGLALLVTLPVSVVVLALLEDGAIMMAALAVCALLNAFVFWVVFRGDPT